MNFPMLRAPGMANRGFGLLGNRPRRNPGGFAPPPPVGAQDDGPEPQGPGNPEAGELLAPRAGSAGSKVPLAPGVPNLSAPRMLNAMAANKAAVFAAAAPVPQLLPRPKQPMAYSPHSVAAGEGVVQNGPSAQDVQASADSYGPATTGDGRPYTVPLAPPVVDGGNAGGLTYQTGVRGPVVMGRQLPPPVDVTAPPVAIDRNSAARRTAYVADQSARADLLTGNAFQDHQVTADANGRQNLLAAPRADYLSSLGNKNNAEAGVLVPSLARRNDAAAGLTDAQGRQVTATTPGTVANLDASAKLKGAQADQTAAGGDLLKSQYAATQKQLQAAQARIKHLETQLGRRPSGGVLGAILGAPGAAIAPDDDGAGGGASEPPAGAQFTHPGVAAPRMAATTRPTTAPTATFQGAVTRSDPLFGRGNVRLDVPASAGAAASTFAPPQVAEGGQGGVLPYAPREPGVPSSLAAVNRALTAAAGAGDAGSLPQPRTAEEAKRLPRGTKFLAGDGQVRVVP